MRMAGVIMALSLFSAATLSADDKLYSETYRPQFHFTAAKNWLNDPNGLVFYKGEYHLFFQHNPAGINWGNMTWGHAVSRDLVYWRQLENALLPDKLGTIFSGSAAVDWSNTTGFQSGPEKTLVAMYTAAGGTSPESKGQPFTQCLAYSNDRGRTWTKYDKNPVLANVVKENRDPKIVWHTPTKRWIVALFRDGETFGLFASPDLKNWTHLQDITMPGSSECPDFFEIPVDGDPDRTRWILTAANGRYLVGTFDGQHFKQESGPHPADFGTNYYAVQTYSDAPDGRRIQIAWMSGGKYPDMPFNQQMSFPCEMKLRETPDGLRLFRTPVAEIERLHRARHTWAGVELAEGHAWASSQSTTANGGPVAGDLFDIHAEIAPGTAKEIILVIRGELIAYKPASRELACLGKTAKLSDKAATLKLQILVDRTSLEIFVNGGEVAMTSCFLPKLDMHGLELKAVGGTARATSLDVHELASAWVEATSRPGD